MKRKLLLAVTFVTIIAVLALLSLAAAEDKTRAQGDYQGYTSCAGASCHDGIISEWENTLHSQAWNVLNASGEKQDWCEVCHTTGAEDTAHNGFDPATDQPDYLKNVQCESCHGPDPMNSTGGPSTRVNLSAEVCATCHRTASFGTTERKYHPYYDEWINSSHSRSLEVNGGKVVTDPNCRTCHVSQVAIVEVFGGGTFTGEVSDPQPITCATCHDPHGSPNPFQLRKPVADLCASCHHPTTGLPGGLLEHPQSAMRKGTSEIPPDEVPSSSHMDSVLCADCHMYATSGPPRITGHEFKPKPEACAVCHSSGVLPQLDVNKSASIIDYWQEMTHEYVYATTNNVTISNQMLQVAESLGFPQSVIEQAKSLFNYSNYSLVFVEADGSQGVHNPTYAWNLLNFSNEKANEIISLLRTGSVVGRIRDDEGNPLQGVRIIREGFVLAVTDRGGSFSFDYAPGNFTFEVEKDGETLGRIGYVEVIAGEVTDVGTNYFPPPTPDYTIYMVILAIVIILVLALVVYWFRLKRSGEG